MVKVDLSYNPYFITTTLLIDGHELDSASSLYTLWENKRLEFWVSSFYEKLYDELRDKEISIVFHGTMTDGEEFQQETEMFKKEHKDFTVNLTLDTKPSADNRKKELLSLYEEGKRCPFSEIADIFNNDMTKRKIMEALAPEFEINVVATMSSGKSTLLNSLLGIKLMPARNQACTATIARITHDDNLREFEGERYNSSDNRIGNTQKVDYTVIDEWNSDPRTSRIDIRGKIPAIEKTGDANFVFIDTPGTNNSMDKSHQRKTLETIKSKPLSMVLYVLNSTQLEINDDKWLLRQVSEAMSSGERQAHDRFIFVANKIDEFDPENRKDTVASALKSVNSYLTGNGIIAPVVIPVSALLASLIRYSRNDDYSMTRKERGDYSMMCECFVQEKEMNMLEHSKENIAPASFNRLQNLLDSAIASNDLNRQAEILSGIPIIEEILNNFLHKYAIPAKLKDVVDTFHFVMDQAKIAENLLETLSQSDKEIQDLKQQIEVCENDSRRLDMAKQFRERVKKTQYKRSAKTENILIDIAAKSENLVSKMSSKLYVEDRSAIEAERYVWEVKCRCHNFETEIYFTMSKALRNESCLQMEQLRDEYQKYAESVLNEQFPDNSSLREMQREKMKMPTVDEMVESQRYTKNVVTGSHIEWVGTWWNPFSWGDYERRYETEERDFVDTRKIADVVATSLRLCTTKNFEQFDKEAARSLEESKKTLLKIMDEIDAKVKENQKTLLNSLSSKEGLEKKRELCRKQLEWCNAFKSKLDDILSI